MVQGFKIYKVSVVWFPRVQVATNSVKIEHVHPDHRFLRQGLLPFGKLELALPRLLVPLE